MGASFIGYAENIDTEEIIKFDKINAIETTSIRFLVLEKDKALCYRVDQKAEEILELIRKEESLRDKGIFHPSFAPVKKIDSSLICESRESSHRVLNYFDQLTIQRKSANEFYRPPKDEILHEVLLDSFGYRDVSKRFFSSAGAISEFQVGVFDREKNNYRQYCFETKQLFDYPRPDLETLFKECLLGQVDYQNASTWVLIVLDLEKMTEKYGSMPFGLG